MGKYSLMVKRKGLHHPMIVRTGSIFNGRHLDEPAVNIARAWREKRIEYLTKLIGAMLASPAQVREYRRIKG